MLQEVKSVDTVFKDPGIFESKPLVLVISRDFKAAEQVLHATRQTLKVMPKDKCAFNVLRRRNANNINRQTEIQHQSASRDS